MAPPSPWWSPAQTGEKPHLVARAWPPAKVRPLRAWSPPWKRMSRTTTFNAAPGVILVVAAPAPAIVTGPRTPSIDKWVGEGVARAYVPAGTSLVSRSIDPAAHSPAVEPDRRLEF